jgi:hypothetical protein
MEQNEEAWELWSEVKTQWRASGFSILGLAYPSLYLEAERLQIKLTPRTMRKIKALEAACLREARKKPPEEVDDPDHAERREEPGEMAG